MRSFISANTRVCRKLDHLLSPDWRTDGNFWFHRNILVDGFEAGDRVYDLGGGSRPWFSPEEKSRLNLVVIGLDIEAKELEAAPPGSYDEMIAADLCTFSGRRDADKVICQATLEHVSDVNGALRAISSVLKAKGKAYVFAPCRNAVFARLNRALSQDFKKRLLISVFPHAAEGHEGFPAPYDRCTPKQIAEIATRHGMDVRFKKAFWMSSYFDIFLPAYLAWRVQQRLARWITGDEACESFCLILQKV